MNDRTIRESLKYSLCNHYEDECVECSMINICKEDVDRCLSSILARLKAKVMELRKPTFQCECDGDKQDHCHCGARDREIEARKIDQVLKVLESELTNGK